MTNSMKLELDLMGTLHIGQAKHDDERVDQTILKREINGEQEVVIPANVIKGTMRRQAYLIAPHLFPSVTINNEEQKFYEVLLHHYAGPKNAYELEALSTHPYVTLFGIPELAGKLRFHDADILDDGNNRTRLQSGIRVNRELLSAKLGALFTTEMAEVNRIAIPISYSALNSNELALLLATINSLRGSSLGGKGKVGAGIIESVIIKQFNNKEIALKRIEKLLAENQSNNGGEND